MKISHEAIMKKIAIRQPYFALRDIESGRDGITAYITVEQPRIRGEIGNIGANEIARHLAIAGTIANGLQETSDSLIYYLATGAKLKILHTVAEQKGKDFKIESSGKRLNKREAQAISVLKSKDGNILYSILKTNYYLLTQKVFSKLYKEHYKDLRQNNRTETTQQDRGNIYQEDNQLKSRIENNKITAQLKIQDRYCMGHFPQYPCLPVAFCCGYLYSLAGNLLLHSEKVNNFFIKHAKVDAKELVFADDIINFKVEYIEQKESEYIFNTGILKDNKEKIKMRVTLQGV